MTVMATISEDTFLGNGTTGPFSFTFKFFANSDIDVYRVETAGEVLLTEGVDYTLTGAGTEAGGSITLTAALAVGTSLRVERNTDMRQLTSIRNQGAFYPEIHENVFDRLTLILQELDRRIIALENRVYTVQITQVSGGTVQIANVPTALGPVEVQFPASGTVKVVKDGNDANEITFAVSVGGQTIDAYLPLSVDGEFIEFTLVGIRWRRTG